MSIVDPSVLELLNHAESRYTLVVEASKRGREIVNGALPMIDAEGMKPLKTAVEEINRGFADVRQCSGTGGIKKRWT